MIRPVEPVENVKSAGVVVPIEAKDVASKVNIVPVEVFVVSMSVVADILVL